MTEIIFTGKHDEAIITLHMSNWFFGRKKPVRFRGSCTVWHEADTGKRVSSSLESRLCNIWTKATWDQK